MNDTDEQCGFYIPIDGAPDIVCHRDASHEDEFHIDREYGISWRDGDEERY